MRASGCGEDCQKFSSAKVALADWPPRANPVGTLPPEPRGDLPVAANPAMPPAHVGRKPGRKTLEQLHVVDQPATRETAFDQVVAEYAVFREAAAKHGSEGVHVVDAFADEAAFAENVLINVARLLRIGIDARIAGKKLREQRFAAPRES